MDGVDEAKFAETMAVRATRCGPPPTTWTMARHDGANNLGLFCDALPEHQMALITSDYAPSRNRPPALGAVTVAAASKPAKL